MAIQCLWFVWLEINSSCNKLYCGTEMLQKILPKHELPDLVTVPEAAKFLGVGRKVVYQLLEYGELRAIRRQSKILIAPCSLYEFQSKGTMV